MVEDFWKGKRVLITGGNGFLGSHLVDKLVYSDSFLITPFSQDYDLRYMENIKRLFEVCGPFDLVFNLAANVGGIDYNQRHSYNQLYDNIILGVNLIHYAIDQKIPKFIQVGTTCSYPKWTHIPFSEDNFWDGYPEETNAPYGLAKKLLLVQLQAAKSQFGFNGIYLIPTNLYGPRDEFDSKRSHVIPALIKKVVEAKENRWHSFEVWGTGKPTRDFLYVDDCADALILAAESYDNDKPLNLGSGEEISILNLAVIIKKIVGYDGNIIWNPAKPDGQPRRALDTKNARYSIDWKAETTLDVGLQKTVEWYLEELSIA